MPPYDDPMLMAYLLFPNRGKYELADVVFDFMGQTVAPEDERTPWINRLFDELEPRTKQEVAGPYHEIELPLSPVLVDMELAGLKIDVRVLDDHVARNGNAARRTDAPDLRDRGLRVQHQFAAAAGRNSVR